MGSGVDIPWTGIKIPWVGGRYIMGTGVDIPWVRRSIYLG